MVYLSHHLVRLFPNDWQIRPIFVSDVINKLNILFFI
nr:MAG TPA: hypothetical protein [Caudoviricetes sp.]